MYKITLFESLVSFTIQLEVQWCYIRCLPPVFNCVVFLNKVLYSLTVPLFNHGYNWVPANFRENPVKMPGWGVTFHLSYLIPSRTVLSLLISSRLVPSRPSRPVRPVPLVPARPFYNKPASHLGVERRLEFPTAIVAAPFRVKRLASGSQGCNKALLYLLFLQLWAFLYLLYRYF